MHGGHALDTRDSGSAARLPAVIIGHELGERDVRRAAGRAGARRRKNSEVSRTGTTVAVLGLKPWAMLRLEVRLHRRAVTRAAL